MVQRSAVQVYYYIHCSLLYSQHNLVISLMNINSKMQIRLCEHTVMITLICREGIAQCQTGFCQRLDVLCLFNKCSLR